MSEKAPKLAIVVPCYNEEEVLHETTSRLTAKLIRMIDAGLIAPSSYILYVNDGSKDKTWEIISELNKENKYVAGLCLTRNRGHQNALVAGLMNAKDYSDITISIDADLQDDIEVLDEFVKKYIDGCDIVYGVRSARKTDTAFKRRTAEGFYKVMELCGVEIVFNHADYRLMSKRALEAFAQYKEVNLFLRGIVPTIGFKTDTVTYERHERFAGESKYPLKKMLNFAVDGITSFTVKPIRFIFAAGAGIFAISLAMLVYFLVIHFMGRTVPGWTTLAVSIWALGGLQLLSIGVVGEYVGKIYLESKERPRYFIKDVLPSKSSKEARLRRKIHKTKKAATDITEKVKDVVREVAEAVEESIEQN